MPTETHTPTATVELLTAFRGSDLHDLCDATELAIDAGGGFGWVRRPPREGLERYWRGVLAVPARSLLVGRLDGVIAGSTQLVRPPPNNEAQACAISFVSWFVAPWARGHGLARRLLETAEQAARAEGFHLVNVDLRETQEAAIALLGTLGYMPWGTHPHYARVDGRAIAGQYFYKLLNGAADETQADGRS